MFPEEKDKNKKATQANLCVSYLMSCSECSQEFICVTEASEFYEPFCLLL